MEEPLNFFEQDLTVLLTSHCLFARSGLKTDSSDPKVTIEYKTSVGSWTLLDVGSTDLDSVNGSSNSYTWPAIPDENDDTTCTICFSYKARVQFVPCNHNTCISCSLKIPECHICRSSIKYRAIF